MVVATTGTRLKILKLLQEWGEASVSQLSEALNLATATVRRHLDVLLRDRLVAFHEVRKSLGRPQYTFTLTEEGQETLPKHYHELLGSLLSELSHLAPDDVRGLDDNKLPQLLFSRMAEEVTKPYAQEDLKERLSSLMQILTEGDFAPEMEDLDGGLRIHLHNCPYRAVAQSQESVCLLDQALISNMLQAPVERELCIRNGDRHCCYVAAINRHA